ncbi:hypothetical protein NKH48_14145 [Mesorhizobium sp. M1233]|uniref:hypothetical protein n=1 Tax=Mesorhizobium sp. M1233 TaxID=2957072 RepID=UPI0033384CDE
MIDLQQQPGAGKGSVRIDEPNGHNDRTDLDQEKQLEPMRSLLRFGPDLQITIPASGCWKCRT